MYAALVNNNDHQQELFGRFKGASTTKGSTVKLMYVLEAAAAAAAAFDEKSPYHVLCRPTTKDDEDIVVIEVAEKKFGDEIRERINNEITL